MCGDGGPTDLYTIEGRKQYRVIDLISYYAVFSFFFSLSYCYYSIVCRVPVVFRFGLMTQRKKQIKKVNLKQSKSKKTYIHTVRINVTYTHTRAHIYALSCNRRRLSNEIKFI